MPLFHLIERYVLAAERLHGDDTTIRILAKNKCTTGRIWTYVRDDRPFAALPGGPLIRLKLPRRRASQKHLAVFAGILQADCYNRFDPLFDPKKTLPVTPAYCFAHDRRGFFELARHRAKCLGRQRRANRSHRSHWRRSGGWTRCSRSSAPSDGRICLTKNCAERALRGIALGRRNWTFAGSQRGADGAAIMLTMITTCRLNDVDPKARVADVLARIGDLPASRLHQLLPRGWKLLRMRQAGNSVISKPPDLSPNAII